MKYFLTVYHLITKPTSVRNSEFFEKNQQGKTNKISLSIPIFIDLSIPILATLYEVETIYF
jgi:hypothetical protein